jgi:SAM-dependent methyltransferase
MTRRRHHLPWKAAGTDTEQQHSADEVVREAGWMFNNRSGRHLDLRQFVETGNNETMAYLGAFGLVGEPMLGHTLVEIGSGIGRMTASFTQWYAKVIACDLDAAFLERCRETVAAYGKVDRLVTCHVDDGHTLHLADDIADVTFSYITLQHCSTGDALALAREAVRVTKPGGHIALNFRTWTSADAVLWPGGKMVRGMWRIPRLGKVVARQRVATRLGWQANRLTPQVVLAEVGAMLTDVRVFRSPKRRPFAVAGTTDAVFEGVHRSHWWLVATVGT